MTEAERDAIRRKVIADDQKVGDRLALSFVGKFCPLLKDECKGPNCTFFLSIGGPDGKISGGACSIPLIASQIGPVADGLMAAAQAAAGRMPQVVSPQLIK